MKKIWNNEKIYEAKFAFNEKCRNLFSIIKEYFKTKKLSSIYPWGGGILLLILVLGISFSLANLTPQRSVEIYSKNLNYESNEEGAWKVTKSSYWTDQGTAKINFTINSILKPVKRKVDVVLVIDTSASMVEDRLNRVKSGTKELISSLLGLDGNNKIALISFNSTSTILSDFTRDTTALEPQIDNLIAEGNTNYYQALNNVDEVLSDYVAEDGRDCVVVFLTDGYPNEDTPNEKGKASELKAKYPYLTINSISYEMGEANNSSLKSISDSVTIAGSGTDSEGNKQEIINIKDAFYYASIGLTPYSSFIIEDTINSEYFDIIKTTEAVGEVEIVEEDGNSKIVWNLGENYYSGTIASLGIEIKLKDEYLNTAGVFQTNIQEVITSTIGDVNEDVTSSLTPVIADNYMVTYDGNAPEDCTVDGVPEAKNHSVFTTVEISDEEPTCSGYKFKGWKVTGDNVTKVGSDYFVMPESHVSIKAEWSSLKLTKSMAGDISEVKPLYEMMASNSVPDNIASEYVTSSTGINFSKISSDTNGKGIYMMASTAEDEYPVYYYRGAVENNNVKFANFCWKIVRTTDTGGVKLIYNGLPDVNGGCTNTTGEETTIGQSKFNSTNNSLAYVGYMYGTRYESTQKGVNWSVLAGKSETYKGSMSSTKYYYSDSVSYNYDETSGSYKYTLNDATQYLWSSYYSSMVGKYTCLSASETSCEKVKYVEKSYSSYMYYVELSGGETHDSIIEALNNTKWIYGNDVEYKDTDGNGTSEYVLVDTYESVLGKWSDEYTTIASKYHYTCFSESDSCEQVYYVHYVSGSYNYYITLTGGNKVDDALKEMLSESSNDNDSTIKSYIDDWYEKNLIGFTEQLEDTVWCNDRSISSYNGWVKDGKATISLSFDAKNRSSNPSLLCNLNDSFTVEKTYKNGVQVGNGNLTYPVALLTSDEVRMAGGSSSSNSNYYLYNNLSNRIFALNFYDYVGFGNIIQKNGFLSVTSGYMNTSHYVRPSVSLKIGTKARSGDGTANNPYVVGSIIQ